MNEQQRGFIREKWNEVKNIPQSMRTHNKAATQLGISALSFFLFPIGPGIIGTVNVWNTIDEGRNVHNKKENASAIRTGMYALAAAYEYGLQFAGVYFRTQEAAFINQHFGLLLPDFVHPILGLLAGGGAGMITGWLTNTTLWEARRGIPSITANAYRAIRRRITGK